MKKSTLAMAALAAVVPATLAMPALAEPKLSVGGQIFTDYSFPLDTNGNSKQSFNVNRAMLAGKVKFDDQFSGNVTYNVASLKYLGAVGATATSTEASMANLTLAYLQHEGVIPGATMQLGLVATPWAEYEVGTWGYRMLGVMPTFGGIASAVTGAKVSGTSYVPVYDKGLKLSGKYLGGMVTCGLGMFNGESYRAVETDGQKSYQGRLSLAPIEGLDLTILGHKGNLNATAQADAYSGALTYSTMGAKISGQYTMTATVAAGSNVNGTVMTGFAIVPTFVLPVDVVLRGDLITPDANKSTTNRMEATLGLSYKPTAGVVVVLDDQIVNNTVSGTALAYNVVALHTAVTF